MANDGHVPVLRDEVLEVLDPRPGDVVADLTAGGGGHAAALAQRIGPGGTLVLMDLDAGNLEQAAKRVVTIGPTVIELHGNFATAAAAVRARHLQVNCVLADLGFASTQMSDPNRGFSFAADGPLDMRMDPSGAVTAANLVNDLPEGELARVLREVGEEPLGARIARKIALARQGEPIRTTARLASLVRDAYGSRAHRSRNDPATRTFMALRIAVNDELASLEALLSDVETGARAGGQDWLATAARIAVIAFHSLEDRRVKRAFSAMEDAGLASRTSRRPVRPSEAEVDANPRSRSAKLRGVRLA